MISVADGKAVVVVNLGDWADTLRAQYSRPEDHTIDALMFFRSAALAWSRGHVQSEFERNHISMLVCLLGSLLEREPAAASEAATAPPVRKPPRRRHRKLGPNVVDLVATRREREDAEVVF